ncbi:hypothetical protein LEN26_017860 [Aphanomyces euteiches]|nr:hypothetical protein LEN26_017860 [Aphanomyces euteiches]KAH9102399.1 hypothetical protein AeMF1_021007 [Aphanomyces euteiches]KAH9185208.1 hypothetical protein AeNC1_012814 [Aphanomyces euteiches]
MAFGFGMSKEGKVPSTPKCPELTPTQAHQLKAVAHMTCSDLVYASSLTSNCKHGVKWTPMDSDNKKLQYYSGRVEDPLLPHDVRFMCCMTKVQASLEEVIDILNGNNRSSFAKDIKANLESDLAVSAKLKTLKNVDRLKMRLKWMVLKSSSPLTPMRDFVFLECQNNIRVMGRAGWASNMHSVALPNFPSFESSHNVVRASFYRTGYVVTETHTPDEVRVVHMMQVDFKAHDMPEHVAEMIMATRVGNIGYLNEFFRKVAILDRMVIPMPQLRREAKKCYQCNKRFNLLTKKHTCRLCGDIVCSSCSLTKDFEVLVRDLSRIRICNYCNTHDNDEVLQSILTEVLLRNGIDEGDEEVFVDTSAQPRRARSSRESNILNESDDGRLYSVNSSNKRIMSSGAHHVIMEEEEEEIEPLPLPHVAYLDEKAKRKAATTQHPFKRQSSREEAAVMQASRQRGQSQGHAQARVSANAVDSGLEWLDPLNSLRSSTASSQGHRKGSHAGSVSYSLVSSLSSSEDIDESSSFGHDI